MRPDAAARHRLDDRRRLLAQLDRMKRALRRGRADGMDRDPRARPSTSSRRRRPTPSTCRRKTAGVVGRYDTAPLVRPENIDKKWKNYNNYVDNAKSLGKLLLLARRLCERGCGFVTVTTNFVWDMHADANNAPVAEGMALHGAAARPCPVGVPRRRGGARPERQDPAGGLRRDGPDAEDQQDRRPRPLGQPRPAAARRRRSEDGPGGRPVHAQRAANRPPTPCASSTCSARL